MPDFHPLIVVLTPSYLKDAMPYMWCEITVNKHEGRTSPI